MADTFSDQTAGLEAPASHAAAVTPSDSTDLAALARALYVGVLGDVRVTLAGGETVTFVGAQGILPVRAARVLATSTTATNILALW